MTEKKKEVAYPSYLNSYGDLLSYFQSQFDGLENVEKGRRFSRFSNRIISLSELGDSYETPVPSDKESYDGGVDASAKSKVTDDLIFVQSKYTIAGVDDFDLIISKFKNFANDHLQKNTELTLFPEQQSNSKIDFVIVTASKIEDIIKKYERSGRSSLAYYSELKSRKGLHIIHGLNILSLLKGAYRKIHILPSNVKLKLETDYINKDNVYIGVVSSIILKQLYDEFGDALFLENIREYLGEYSGKIVKDDRRETVNRAITRTLEEEPENFLARNNGVTFRASKVTSVRNDYLKLEDASIVNGCQTTISIVNHPVESSHVLIKVVETDRSWDVAKSANFQNHINQVDLELAQYIRPQVIRKSADMFGVQLDSESESPYAILDTIYNRKIEYEFVKALFIGFFSRTPNNAIENNYTEIRSDILTEFFQEDEVEGLSKDELFEILFTIAHTASKTNEAIADELKKDEDLGDLFQRFIDDRKLGYRAFVTILASCGSVKKNYFSEKNHSQLSSIIEFLKKLKKILDENPIEFKNSYFNSFKVLAMEVLTHDSDRDKILQAMYKKVRTANFDVLYKGLKIQGLSL